MHMPKTTAYSIDLDSAGKVKTITPLDEAGKAKNVTPELTKTADGTIQIPFTPVAVKIKAVDENTKEALENVNLQILDSKEGIVESWTTQAGDKAVYTVSGKLPLDASYKVHELETAIPAGYLKAADVAFKITAEGAVETDSTVTKDGDVILVPHKPTSVKISVVDASGKAVSGAKAAV